MTPDGLSIANDLLQRNGVALTEIIVGINRRGTSARDLHVARAVLAQSNGALRYYIDGKLAGPIYHPKVWFMESSVFRGALVGSSNLTREALLNNVEAGVLLTDQGELGRNEASDALDDLNRQIALLSASRFSVDVDEAAIARLVEIGAIPESAERARRDDADDGAAETTSADDLLGVREPRFRSAFQPATPLPGVTTNGGQTAGVAVGVAAVPAGARLRYVRYYGFSEANRVRKYQNELGAAGTFEVNLTMESRAEEQFWGYPDKFIRTGTALQWSPRIRLITIRDGNPIVTLIPSGRLWSRLRDGRESEVRFRFTNTAAVRDAFPTDIEKLTLLVVDRVDDHEADFEVRLLGRRDPGYAALRPSGDGPYEYRIVR
jgi:hypothetical protein